MSKRLDLIGKKFGRLAVISLDEELTKKTQRTHYLCTCDCGNTKIAKGSYLIKGYTQSCGCVAKEIITKRNTIHGLSKTPIYKIWKGIRKRCNNQNNADYKWYGGKGITLSNEWQNYENFYNDMICSWFEGATIERIDGNKGYFKDNCKWITIQEQQRNKSDSLIVTYKGNKYQFSDLLEQHGLFNNYQTIYSRLKADWSVEKAIDTPIRKLGGVKNKRSSIYKITNN